MGVSFDSRQVSCQNLKRKAVRGGILKPCLGNFKDHYTSFKFFFLFSVYTCRGNLFMCDIDDISL
jgi:hypothetical protein